MTLSPASALVVAVPRRLRVRFDAAVSAALRHITVVAFTIAPGLRLARLPTTRVPWLFLASAGGLDTSASQDAPICEIYIASPPHSHMGSCHARTTAGRPAGVGGSTSKKNISIATVGIQHVFDYVFRSYDLYPVYLVYQWVDQAA